MSNKWKYIIYGWLTLLTVGVFILICYFSAKNNIIETNYKNISVKSFEYDNNYTPFIQYPNKKDSLGNLTLSSEHLDNIKNHIDYLNKRVDGAISETKLEISNDINRLNTWATWWLAGLAIIAGLLPFLLTLLAKLDIDKAFDGKLDDAKTKAKDAFDNAETAKKDIKEAKEKLAEFEKSFTGLKNTSEDAKNSAEKALKSSSESNTKAETAESAAKKASEFAAEAKKEVDALKQLTHTTTALSKLRMLDAKKMEFIKNRLQYFTEQIELIEKQLRSILNQEDSFFTSDVVKENLLSFYISLRSFRTLFKERNVTQAIVEFHTAMETELKKGMSKSVVTAITEKLTGLLNKLKEIK